MGKRRLSGDERRRAILEAAVPVFAQFGFSGATTKQIAKAAGVSEALLYKHFPSKDVIYSELVTLTERSAEILAMIRAMEPSTESLVAIVYIMASKIYEGGPEDTDSISHEHMYRLMVNSYLEDGAFARIFMERNVGDLRAFFRGCIDEAIKRGDLKEDWIHPGARWWFAHHLSVGMGLLNLPEQQIIPYGFPREQLLDQAVLFMLRGMGMTDAAIEKYYNLESLSQIRQFMLSQANTQTGSHTETHSQETQEV